MANNAKGASDRAKNSAMAQRMKQYGITRTSGLCPICYRRVGLPMDRHFFGGIC